MFYEQKFYEKNRNFLRTHFDLIGLRLYAKFQRPSTKGIKTRVLKLRIQNGNRKIEKNESFLQIAKFKRKKSKFKKFFGHLQI